MYSVWQKTGGGVSVSGSVRTVNELIVSKCAKYRVHKRDFFWQVSFELFWPHVIRLLTKYLRYLKLHSYIETSTNLDRPEKSVETDAHVIVDVIEQWILRVLTSYEWILATFFIFCTMWLSSSLLALQRTLYLIGLCFFFVDAHILGFVSSITLTYNDTATLDNTINVSYKDNTLQYLITIHNFLSKTCKEGQFDVVELMVNK